MTKDEIMEALSNCCSSCNQLGVQKILTKYRGTIDLTYNEGEVWKIVIARNSIELLHLLLNFYQQTKLKDQLEEKEYKKAQHQLFNILRDAEESLEISPKIMEIIAPYLIEEEESDNEQDLSGFDIQEKDSVVDEAYHTKHKSYSAPEFLVHQPLIPGLLYSSSESLIGKDYEHWGIE